MVFLEILNYNITIYLLFDLKNGYKRLFLNNARRIDKKYICKSTQIKGLTFEIAL